MADTLFTPEAFEQIPGQTWIETENTMGYRKHYSGDPRWITARYPATCAKNGCEQPIGKGDRAFYYPRGRALYARPCGHADACDRDFAAAAFDEDIIGG